MGADRYHRQRKQDPQCADCILDEVGNRPMGNGSRDLRGLYIPGTTQGGHITTNSMGDQAIYDMLIDLGIPCAPHDARRTMAQLAHLGGCAIEQIQLTLGHSSITTTQRYLGVKQNLTDAPADHLGLSFAGN